MSHPRMLMHPALSAGVPDPGRAIEPALLRAFDAFAEAVVVVDRQGCISYLNASAERLYGHCRRDILGTHVNRLSPPDLQAHASHLLAGVLEGAQGQSLETEGLHRDGRRLNLWISVAPWSASDGSVKGMIILSRDLGPVREQVREKDRSFAESEASYRTLVELSPEAMFVHCEGRIVWANDAAVRMLRADNVGALVGRDHLDFVHPGDRDRIVANGAAALGGTRVDFVEARRLRCDGTEFIGEGRGARLVWQAVPALVVTVRDVSERRRAQAAVEASEDRHRRIVAKNPDAVIIHCDGVIVYANHAARDLFRARSEADLLGRPYLDLVPERDREQAMLRRKQVLDEGATPLRECARLRLDGTVITAEVTSVRYSWNGQSAVLSFLRDVTPRVEAERGRAEAEELYRRILALNPQAILVHCDGIIVFVNVAAVAMFGATTAADLIGRDVMDFIHPDDRESVRQARKEIAEGRKELAASVRRNRLDGTPFESEATGTWITWHDRPAFMAIIRDVTREREAIAALRRSEHVHRTMIESLPDATMIHVDGRIVYANRAAARMFRVGSPEDLCGERIIDTVHPEDRLHILNSVRTLAAGEALPTTASRRIRRTGEVFFSEGDRCGYVWRGQPATLVILRECSEDRFTALAGGA